ncbi:MAG: DUF3035 domain-containing protein [Alphaproteobacteria bacterium]|nr:hypothetical protein [Hyphomonas sp.]MBR9807149.1 DUF3035 domain-containing protein [Alphaproteobacteria bacterium]|tara:strand:- start:5270 stop:5764 length:495 start_codon:yes stop_codon:yes gene_type:complete
MKKQLFLLAAGAAVAASTACTSSGGGARTPDEFRVVTMAPLTVPPNYKLRPPSAGSSLPPELDGTRNETATAFGTTIGQDASASERALVAAANANAVDPIIRTEVDYEETKTLRKPKSIADRILFWRSDDEETIAGLESDSATGGEEVTIERTNEKARIKLPGT